MGAVNQYQAVYDIVAQIPYGHVSTYGALARMVYVPRGARGVGWALAIARQADLPWWRVVAAGGRITSPDAPLQYDMFPCGPICMLTSRVVSGNPAICDRIERTLIQQRGCHARRVATKPTLITIFDY
jgi:alkylated DNA nucleotide flippase Atl1